MGLSGVMLINRRGEIVLYRAYRDDVSRESADAFRMNVVAKLETSSQAPVQLLDGTNFLCVRVNELYLVGMGKANCNAFLITEFLYQLGRVLKAYLGENLSETEIRSNFTLVYELLDETMDFGYPQNCSVEVLKMYINLGKVKAIEADKTTQLTAQITGAIDWRRPDIKHKTNEVYIVITEEVSVIVSTDGGVLGSEVSGQVKMKVCLSGMPECKLGLNDKLILDKENDNGSFHSSAKKSKQAKDEVLSRKQSVEIADCTFHRCVRLGKFDADRTITFIPPDGEFDLMKYRITENVQLPFKVLPVVEEVGKTKVFYNLRLIADFSKKKIGSNIVLRIPCPQNTAKTKPVVSKGRAKYDPVQHCVIWRIRRMQGESEATFSCQAELVPSTREKVWSRPPIQMEFNLTMFTASGLIVRFLKVVEKSMYKPERWVRYITKAGNYQIRI